MHPLTFSLANLNPAAAGKAIIYNTTNKAFNQLQLTVTNNGPDMKLKGGDPMSENQLKNGQTGLYLNFGQLLKDSGTSLKVKSAGWRSGYTPAKNWALSPGSDFVLKNSEKLTIDLTGFTVNPSVATGYLTIDYLNFTGLRNNSVQLHIAVLAPPIAGDQPLDFLFIEREEEGRGVFLTAKGQTPFTNNLSFNVRNSSRKPIKSGPTTVFTISGVFGNLPGYGALCTPGQSKDIQLTTADGNPNNWTIVKDSAGEVPTWHFQPRGLVIGIDENAIQKIDLKGLVSSLEPGLTSLYLSWNHVPGYNAGTTSLVLNKKRQPVISAFTVTPDKLVVKEASEEKAVTLKWEVANSPDLVLLEGLAVADQGQQEMLAGVSKSEFNLSATFGRNHSVRKRIKVVVAYNQVAIDEFSADRSSLNLRGNRSIPVKITWSVSNATSVSFSGNLISGLQPNTGERTIQLSLAQLSPLPNAPSVYGYNLTIKAKGQDGQSVAQTLMIYASILPMRMQVVDAWMNAAKNWSIQYPKQPVFNALYVLGEQAQSGLLPVIEDANSNAMSALVTLLVQIKTSNDPGRIPAKLFADKSAALTRVSAMYNALKPNLEFFNTQVLAFYAAYLTDSQIDRYMKIMEQDDMEQFGLYTGSPLQISKNFLIVMPEIASDLLGLAAQLNKLATTSGPARNTALQAAIAATEKMVKTLNGYTFG